MIWIEDSLMIPKQTNSYLPQTPTVQQKMSDNSLMTSEDEASRPQPSEKQKSDSQTLKNIDAWFLENGFTDSTEEMIGKSCINLRMKQGTD
jgi:hypothetical protein